MLEDYGLCIWQERLLMDGVSVGFSLVGEGIKVCRHPIDMLLRLIV